MSVSTDLDFKFINNLQKCSQRVDTIESLLNLKGNTVLSFVQVFVQAIMSYSYRTYARWNSLQWNVSVLSICN